jgi:uncharacterized protein YciI
MADLEAAYAPFVASLLAGGFAAPADGEWPAELVAAHVASNNDLIAETAERIIADPAAAVSYDNARTVDAAELTRLAAAAGGLAGLAGEVERSAARLARAGQALGALAGTPVHVLIRDGGAIVRDGPVPIGAFIEGNAGFHLEAHHDQLNALHGPWTADPPPEFDSFQLVLLVRPPDTHGLDEAALASNQRRHLGHFAKMRAAGFLVASGPIRGDDQIAGICIYRAGSTERARALAEDDPAVRAGRFRVQVMGWVTGKGALGPGPARSADG